MTKQIFIKSMIISLLFVLSSSLMAQENSISLDIRKAINPITVPPLQFGGGDYTIGGFGASTELATNLNNVIEFQSNNFLLSPLRAPEKSLDDVSFDILNLNRFNLEGFYESLSEQEVKNNIKMQSSGFIHGRVRYSLTSTEQNGMVNCPETSASTQALSSPFACFEGRDPDENGEWLITRDNAIDVCSCFINDIPADKLFSRSEYNIVAGSRTTLIRNRAADQFLAENAAATEAIRTLTFFGEDIPPECTSFDEEVEKHCAYADYKTAPLLSELNSSKRDIADTTRLLDSEKMRTTVPIMIRSAIELFPRYREAENLYDKLISNDDQEFTQKFVATVRRNGLPNFTIRDINNVESRMIFESLSPILANELRSTNFANMALQLRPDGTSFSAYDTLERIRERLFGRAKQACEKTNINIALFCNIDKNEAKEQLLKQSVIGCDKARAELEKTSTDNLTPKDRQQHRKQNYICDTLNFSGHDFFLLLNQENALHNKHQELTGSTTNLNQALLYQYKPESISNRLITLSNLPPMTTLRQSKLNNQFFDHMFRCEYYNSLVFNVHKTNCAELKEPKEIAQCHAKREELLRVKELNIRELIKSKDISLAEARQQIEDNFDMLSQERRTFFKEDIEIAFEATAEDVNHEFGDGHLQITDGSVIDESPIGNQVGRRASNSNTNRLPPSIAAQTPPAGGLGRPLSSGDSSSNVEKTEPAYEAPIQPAAPQVPVATNENPFSNIRATDKDRPIKDLEAKSREVEEFGPQEPTTDKYTSLADARIDTLEKQIANKDDQLKKALAQLEQTRIQAERQKLEEEAKRLEEEKANLEKERQELARQRASKTATDKTTNKTATSSYVPKLPTTVRKDAGNITDASSMAAQQNNMAGPIDTQRTRQVNGAGRPSGANGAQYAQTGSSAPGITLSKTQNVVVDKIEGDALVITREMFEQGKFRKDVSEFYISTDKGYEKYIKNENGEFVPETEIVKPKSDLAELAESLGEAEEDPTEGVVEIPPLVKEVKPEEPRRRNVISNEELEKLLNTDDPSQQ